MKKFALAVTDTVDHESLMRPISRVGARTVDRDGKPKAYNDKLVGELLALVSD
jgi:hypothetical protein